METDFLWREKLIPGEGEKGMDYPRLSGVAVYTEKMVSERVSLRRGNCK